MKLPHLDVAGQTIPIRSTNTLVIGSGAAGLNAAIHLHALGVEDVIIASSKVGGGTSHNAGSDKQTYYKLGLAGAGADSVVHMARDLASGGAMHGDIALAEAASSAREFYHLVELGVPFPSDRYGAYAGYRTDHDPRQRGTSAGPLTSRYMVQCLLAQVKKRKIPLLDGCEVVRLLTSGKGRGKRVAGALAILPGKRSSRGASFVAINAVNVILATGGPGSMYQRSVYPPDQVGGLGLGLEIGAGAVNLTESQFGLGSILHRWNVSGSYQQVIPRYFSCLPDGTDEQDFLVPYFPSMKVLVEAIFLKGYQWPFDSRKLAGYGSSRIDLAVHTETETLGRRVFLDYRENPRGGDRLASLDMSDLPVVAREYLEKSNALAPRPVDRLRAMNPDAYRLYKDNGIDLTRVPLEIAVCAQHANGGLVADVWWESNIRHLFPVGEVCGTHGIYRPGGAALNSGQVGGQRAAHRIAARYPDPPPGVTRFRNDVKGQVGEEVRRARSFLDRGETGGPGPDAILDRIRTRMTRCASHVRRPDEVAQALEEARSLVGRLDDELAIETREAVVAGFRCRNLALTHLFYLEAIHEYLSRGGGSRGSFIVLDDAGTLCPRGFDRSWLHREPDEELARVVLELAQTGRGIRKEWKPVRPVPDEEAWFEEVWREFRGRG